MSTPKISASQRARLESRMAEGLDNWERQRKPKPTGKKVAYDWAKRKVVGDTKHIRCMVYGEKYRDNFDRIFRS
jgi:hypothetical protein